MSEGGQGRGKGRDGGMAAKLRFPCASVAGLPLLLAECCWKRCCKQVLRTTAPGTVVATIAGHSHQNGYVLDEVRKQSQQSPMSSSPEKPLLERCENVTCCCCVL